MQAAAATAGMPPAENALRAISAAPPCTRYTLAKNVQLGPPTGAESSSTAFGGGGPSASAAKPKSAAAAELAAARPKPKASTNASATFGDDGPCSSTRARAEKQSGNGESATYGGDGPGNDLVGLRPSKKAKKGQLAHPDGVPLMLLVAPLILESLMLLDKGIEAQIGV